jgi:hypothetical protein
MSPALASSQPAGLTDDILIGINTNGIHATKDIAGLSRQLEESRAQTARGLDVLAKSLDAASSASEGFSALLELAQKHLQLDDLAMSRLLKVSRPTIGRWVRGDSSPHPLSRKAIFDVLAKKARARAKSLRK